MAMEVIANERHYISFGQAHHHVVAGVEFTPMVLFEVDGSYDRAKKVADILFGREYSMIYSADQLVGDRNYEKSVRVEGWSNPMDGKKSKLTEIAIIPNGYISGELQVSDDTGVVLSIHHEGGKRYYKQPLRL